MAYYTKSRRELRAVLKKFGTNVRRERCTRNLTQERLAELADLSTRSIQRIEAGEMNILFPTVIRIQQSLNCPWNKLVPASN